jgi:hypothetical protein
MTSVLAGDITPEQYVRAKYGKHDLVLASKKPKDLDPHEIAFPQRTGWPLGPGRKVLVGTERRIAFEGLAEGRGANRDPFT